MSTRLHLHKALHAEYDERGLHLTKSQNESVAIMGWLTFGLVTVGPSAWLSYWVVGLVAKAAGL